MAVNGTVAAVVQATTDCQYVLDIAASASAEEAIRQGLDDVKHGRVCPARAFFADFEADHGISRSSLRPAGEP